MSRETAIPFIFPRTAQHARHAENHSGPLTRATLFSLVIGLNGFTVSSGIIDRKLNSPSIIARPLEMEGSMRIGLIRKKNVVFSRYADSYVKALKKHLSID